jgi:arylsulfatase A-like enzyme
VLAALAAAVLFSLCATAPKASAARPNFLVIQVDDQADNTFTRRIMPNTFSWIVDGGTLFQDGLAAPPLCCPDRAGVLTGQYPHNHGVFTNDPGYPDLRHKRTTLPVWLNRAGYRTGLVGKFLNNYPTVAGDRPAPGFDSWFSFDSVASYFNYGISDNGTRIRFGSSRKDYSTHVLTDAARRFIDHGSGHHKPFFLWLAYHAPHNDHSPRAKRVRAHCPLHTPLPPGHRELLPFLHLPLPEDPSFNEADVSDKPTFIRGIPQLDSEEVAHVTKRYRCAAAAMHAVDNDIEQVRRELRRDGQLKRTIVVYLSDNGFFFGEHRIVQGKTFPYEQALQVPFAIRVPARYRNGAQHGTSTAVVSNTDIAPTLLDYAGDPAPCNDAGACRVLDGRSLRPLLGGRGRFPADRGVLAEIDTTLGTSEFSYAAIRSPSRLYVQYGGGQSELYNLDTDPFELDNLAGSPAFAVERAELANRLSALVACSGTAGPKACE